MFQFIKNFFTKNNDEEINQIIENNPENWTSEWKEIHHKNKSLDSLSLENYLLKSPGKEELFLNRLKLKSVASQMETNTTHSRFKLVWSLGIMSIIFLVFFLWFFPTAKVEEKIDYTLRVGDFSEKIKLTRNKKNIPFQTGMSLLKSDLFEIKDSTESFTLKSSNYTTFKIQGPAFVELKEVPGDKNEISFYIHKGIISIDSKQASNKPTVYWITKKFTYTPLGTIAKLVVLNGKETLRVDKGSFSISNHETGFTEVAIAGTSIEKEIEQEDLKPTILRNEENKLYGVLQTVILKNGNKYTGYFYRTNGKIWIQTEKEKLELKEEEIETLE